MPYEKSADVAKLGDRKVGRQRCLFPFLSDDSYAHVGSLNHADVIPSVANGADRLLGVSPKQLHHLCLVSRRAATADNDRTLTGQLKELVLVVLDAKLRRKRERTSLLWVTTDTAAKALVNALFYLKCITH